VQIRSKVSNSIRVKPVYVNIPICFKICDQSPGVPLATSAACNCSRISRKRPLMAFSSSTLRPHNITRSVSQQQARCQSSNTPFGIQHRIVEDTRGNTCSMDWRIGVHGTHNDLELALHSFGMLVACTHNRHTSGTLTYARTRTR
jgi:hypothetical protein